MNTAGFNTRHRGAGAEHWEDCTSAFPFREACGFTPQISRDRMRSPATLIGTPVLLIQPFMPLSNQPITGKHNVMQIQIYFMRHAYGSRLYQTSKHRCDTLSGEGRTGLSVSEPAELGFVRSLQTGSVENKPVTRDEQKSIDIQAEQAENQCRSLSSGFQNRIRVCKHSHAAEPDLPHRVMQNSALKRPHFTLMPEFLYRN